MKKIKLEKLDKTKEKFFNSKFIKKAEKYIKKHSLIQYFLIGFALFILAAIFTAQLKTVSTSSELIKGKRESDLITDLTTLRQQYDELKIQDEKNIKVVKEYKSNASNNSELIASMKEDLNHAMLISGLETVVGEGIVVTIDDGDKVLSGEENIETILVHDSDILSIVNELKASGAEAISVNGQRIIAMTSIRCVGPVIQVNGIKIAAPFNIKAIGNSKYLDSALNIKGGIIDTYEAYGIKIKLKRDNKITIEKYDGTLSFKAAKVVD